MDMPKLVPVIYQRHDQPRSVTHVGAGLIHPLTSSAWWLGLARSATLSLRETTV